MKYATLRISFLVLPVFALATPALAQSITVSNADLKSGTLTVDLSASTGGWVVIHQAKDGAPGDHIGHAEIKAGDNKNVQVKLQGEVKPGEDLFAMLHDDTGQKGTFEFKAGGNADMPVMEGGKPVMTKITTK